MLNINAPIKASHHQKIVNQSMLDGALVTEKVNNFFNESEKNFVWSDKTISVLGEKRIDI